MNADKELFKMSLRAALSVNYASCNRRKMLRHETSIESAQTYTNNCS